MNAVWNKFALLGLATTLLLSACSSSADIAKPASPGVKIPAPLPSEIKSTNQTKLADTDYPIIYADPESICLHVSYRNKNGEVLTGRRICTDPDPCTANGQKACLSSAEYPAIDLEGVLKTSLDRIHLNLSIFEVTGTMGDCAATGDSACFVSAGVNGILPSAIDATKIRSSYTLLGITGSISDCSAGTKQNCYVGSSFKAAVKCTDGGSNCYLPTYAAATEVLKAIDVSTILPAIIKKDAVIAGITGDYPSASNPLPVSDADADLVSATFNAQMVSASNFAWFDRNGTRYSRAGDADLTANNLLSGTTIFGVPGGLSIPDVWDVRVGKDVGTTTGKLKASCRNGYDHSTFDIGMPRVVTVVNDTTESFASVAHGFVDGDAVRVSASTAVTPLVVGTTYFVIRTDNDNFQLSATNLGAAIDLTATGANVAVFKWNDGAVGLEDAIDDQNNNSATLIAQNAFGSDSFCSGVESAAGDDKIWKDRTTGGCDALGDQCVFEDKISGLQWTEASVVSHWGFSLDYCEQLSFASQTDWRLPTQKEWMEAQLHNMRSVNNSFWMNTGASPMTFWTSTTQSFTSSAETWTAAPSLGRFVADGRETPYAMACVRP